MRLSILFITLLFTSTICHSQDYSNQWDGHFSFFNITGIANTSNGVSVSAENAVFNHNTSNQLTTTTTTINGLTGNTISTYLYSINYNMSVIGYENGLIDIINSDGEVTTVVGIIDEVNIAQNLKKINHLYEFENLIYISTDYGISVYDIERLEFKETYFIGNNGAQNPIAVNQVTILGDNIYAATANDGIKRALHGNPNIIDFSLWTTISPISLTNWNSIVTHNNNIYAITDNNMLYYYDQTSFNNITTFTGVINSHEVVNDFMIVSAQNTIWVYDNNLNLTYTIPFIPDYQSNFTHATLNNNLVYIGTEENGVLVINPNSNSLENTIIPNGPSSNKGFSITADNDEVWLVYGDHDEFFDPSPLSSYGFSHLINTNWSNTPYSEVLDAKNLVYTAINPLNKSQVFISSYYNGLLEVNNNEVTTLLNHTNTSNGLESLHAYQNPPNQSTENLRIGRSAFDSDGKLWTSNNLTGFQLRSFDIANNSWEKYSLAPIINVPIGDEIGFDELVIDQNNTKWLGGYRKGVIAFKEGVGAKSLDETTGNLPHNGIRALAIDKDNNLWIGTRDGLRVLFNTSNFFNTSNPQAQAIIILDDGIPKELMSGQYITDIEVDGSNNKWIATLDAGVFYVSSDGQQTIYHYTKDNSPLPTNTIIDMSVDDVTGKVFFATDKGVVAFKGLSKEPAQNLENVVIYPNPVRPHMVVSLLGFSPNDISKGIKIDGITPKVNIKVTDISGNLVADANTGTQSGNLSINEGGFAIWNGKNFNNNIVASGVYFIMITDLDSDDTTIEKVMIVK